ncbi:MAG: transcriptional regulator of arginine [Prolixibacteraceae bacterium]|nr:MAG: transcriptional regulator of arginine [Prolixibacteraceae bacterium]
MKFRIQRQVEIRKIIQKENVHSQDELLGELKAKGYELTQATLSRDLKEMQVAKVAHPVKGYVYIISDETKPALTSEKNQVNYLADGFRDLRFSGNLAVIRTQPGYANTIAAVIDKAEPWEILGTVAGDDTILVIMKEGISKLDLINALVLIMPKLEGKI